MHTGRKSKSARKFNLEEMFETTRRTAHDYSAQIRGTVVALLSVCSAIFFNATATKQDAVGEASGGDGSSASTTDDGGHKVTGPLSMVLIYV